MQKFGEVVLRGADALSRVMRMEKQEQCAEHSE